LGVGFGGLEWWSCWYVVYECDEDNDQENHDTMRMGMKMPMRARTMTPRTRRGLYYI
jgi:hypothetical protein